MKLIFLIILLCGITTAPTHTMIGAKAKKTGSCHQRATVKANNIDVVPSGLLFQF